MLGVCLREAGEKTNVYVFMGAADYSLIEPGRENVALKLHILSALIMQQAEKKKGGVSTLGIIRHSKQLFTEEGEDPSKLHTDLKI